MLLQPQTRFSSLFARLSIQLCSIFNQDADEYAQNFQYNKMANEEDSFAEVKPYIIYEEVPTVDCKLHVDINNEKSPQTAAMAVAALATQDFDSKHGLFDVVMKCEAVSNLRFSI